MTRMGEINEDFNSVILIGTVEGHPRQRELPASKQEVFSVRSDGKVVTCVADTLPTWVIDGARVSIVGQVATRFFRVGGATQSRTEVIVKGIT